MMSGETREQRADADAIQRCQQGDISGLGDLAARYQVSAVRLAYLLTGDHELADDIAQDSFLQAYKGIKRFRLGEPFAPWFYRIVTNTARQQWRYARRRREVSLEGLTPGDPVERHVRSAAEDARVGPAERAELAETRAALLDALATLPQKQREAVALRYYFGYNDQEIARILECRLGAVQQRRHAGRGSLQKVIRERYPWLLSAVSALTPTNP
jgi:RNA polymerase sigma-70 factor, ECF subfamily